MNELFVSQGGAFLSGFLLGGLYYYLAQRIVAVHKARKALKADYETLKREGKL